MYYSDEESKMYSILRFGRRFSGHRGIGKRVIISYSIPSRHHSHHMFFSAVHGGCIAAFIDECLGWTYFQQGLGPGFTAYLNINYRSPLPVESTILITSEVQKIEGRKVFLNCRVEDGNGVLFTEADALFIVIKK